MLLRMVCAAVCFGKLFLRREGGGEKEEGREGGGGGEGRRGKEE